MYGFQQTFSGKYLQLETDTWARLVDDMEVASKFLSIREALTILQLRCVNSGVPVAHDIQIVRFIERKSFVSEPVV